MLPSGPKRPALARRLPRAGALALALGLGFSGVVAPKAALAIDAPIAVRELSYEGRRHTLVLAIAGGVTVTTRTLRSPLRMVVDLAGASWTAPRRELVINDAMIKRVRIAQYQLVPPVVRLVIEPTGNEEPTVAVQQTGQRVYITLAKAQGQVPPGPHTHTPPPALSTPAPRPTARPQAPARPQATPRPAAVPPQRLWLRTRLTPEGWTAPEPSATQRPATPAATPRPPQRPPSPATPAPANPGDLETLPEVPTGARLGEGA